MVSCKLCCSLSGSPDRVAYSFTRPVTKLRAAFKSAVRFIESHGQACRQRNSLTETRRCHRTA